MKKLVLFLTTFLLTIFSCKLTKKQPSSPKVSQIQPINQELVQTIAPNNALIEAIKLSDFQKDSLTNEYFTDFIILKIKDKGHSFKYPIFTNDTITLYTKNKIIISKDTLTLEISQKLILGGETKLYITNIKK